MTPTAYFTRRRQRFTALLAACVLFVGQFVIQQHAHADNLPESACAVCVQADHTPSLHSADPLPSTESVVVAIVQPLSYSIVSGERELYLARAPPAS